VISSRTLSPTKSPTEKVGRKATLFLAKSVSTNGDAGG